MRWITILLTVLFLLIVPARHAGADDAAASPETLLDRYLHFPDERESLRPQLLALGAEKLAELIRDYPRPPAPEQGEYKFETACPDGFKRPYWVYVPANYDGETPATLLVCLHGGVMAAPVDSSVAIMRWYAKYITEEGGERPVVMLAASADCYETWMNAAWWRDAGRANIHHFVREAKLRLNIDSDRVFVTGFSDGGSGTFSLAFNSPDAFAGFLPMCGDPLVPITDGIMHAYTNLKGAQIHAFNGGVDPIYPGKELEKLYREANKAGASIDWRIDDEVGHDWGNPDTFFPRQLEFIRKWQRPAVPDVVDWTADRPSRRQWLSVDETGELTKAANKARKPAPRGGGSYRIDLGIKVAWNVDQMGPPVVGRVDPESIADKMGVKPGDLVTKCEGRDVTMFPEIRALLSQKRAGDNITLTVERDGELHTFTEAIPKPPRPTVGRVQAKRGSTVNVDVHDVTKFSIWVSADMLNAKGELTVRLGRETAFSGKVEADPAVLLDEFALTGERGGRYLARVSIDVKQVLKLR